MKLNKYNDCPQFLRDFLFYLNTIVGRSEKTIYEYYLDIRTFLRYTMVSKSFYEAPHENLDEISIESFDIEWLKQVTLSDVYEFMHYISTERENSNETRARKVSSLRGLFRYLSTKTNYDISNPLENLEIPSVRKTVPKYLSLEESIELLDSISGKNKERDYCIFTLFLNCGLRLAELVNINLQDVHQNSIRILGKGNKERIIYLNDACTESIRDYMMVRQNDAPEKEAMFLSRNGNRISRRRVQQIVEENLKLVGLDNMGYSAHKLRHTAATLMFQHGNVDIRVLKDVLGHESISTTEIYTHVSNKQLEQAAKSSPLSGLKRKKTAIPAVSSPEQIPATSVPDTLPAKNGSRRTKKSR